MNIIIQKSKKVNKYIGCDVMWIKRIIGLCAIAIAIGILFALFVPISVLFFIIAVVLIALGFAWLFC